MMMTKCSGKDGWKGYDGVGFAGYLFLESNQNKLIEIFNLENKYRLSEYYQQAYSMKDSIDWAEKVTNELQIRCLKECGVTATEYSLAMLQSSRELISQYCKDNKNLHLTNITIPQRYDHSRRGYFSDSETLPEETEVYDINMKKCNFNGVLKNLELVQNLPIVVVAGSMS